MHLLRLVGCCIAVLPTKALTSSSSMPIKTAASMEIHAPANVPSTKSLQSSRRQHSERGLAGSRTGSPAQKQQLTGQSAGGASSQPQTHCIYLGSFL